MILVTQVADLPQTFHIATSAEEMLGPRVYPERP